MVFLKKIYHSYPLQRAAAALKYRYFREHEMWTIQDAGEKGDGMYAACDIPAHSVIFVATGSIHYFESRNENDAEQYPDWYSFAKDLWIDMQLPYVKANHSCAPNAGIDGSRIFVALRDIAEGEEIVFDYSITDDEPAWQMYCCCQEPDCRNYISSILTLPRSHFNKSYPYIPTYYKKLYERTYDIAGDK